MTTGARTGGVALTAALLLTSVVGCGGGGQAAGRTADDIARTGKNIVKHAPEGGLTGGGACAAEWVVCKDK